jgi:malate dehydrogenase
LHIAQIGTGRVGRPTAYTILCSNLADKITVCDTKPGLAQAFAEELKHVTVSLCREVEILSCDKDKDVADADIILVSSGRPRTPGVQMTRRDLAIENGKIIKQIAASTIENNSKAKYVVITNPVDSMAMVCKKYSEADFVISTGTNLETLRFKAGLAKALAVPVKAIVGWVGGEHGAEATVLWSTVTIFGQPLKEYLISLRKPLSKTATENYVKSISKLIVDNIGGTEYGPAASFRDIVRAIVADEKRIMPIASPTLFKELDEPVFVSIPRKLGNSIGPSIFNKLTPDEQVRLKESAEAIYQTYQNAI